MFQGTPCGRDQVIHGSHICAQIGRHLIHAGFLGVFRRHLHDLNGRLGTITSIAFISCYEGTFTHNRSDNIRLCQRPSSGEDIDCFPLFDGKNIEACLGRDGIFPRRFDGLHDDDHGAANGCWRDK